MTTVAPPVAFSAPLVTQTQTPPALTGLMAPPPAPTTHADMESMTKGDPHFTAERQRARRVALGLQSEPAQAFIEASEFVSLGCYCGVSCALQAVGLRSSAYPFDWVRASVEGIIHCFDNDFVDFLTFSACKVDAEHQGYLSARWGGSFWHHKPDDPKVRDDFIRRIERMLGLGTVAPTKARVFVRAVNSTRELDATAILYQSLQRALPQASVYLVVLIDFQEEKGPFRVRDIDEHVVFFRIHKSVWDPPADIHKVDDPYSEAVAFAVHYWTGQENAKTEITELESIGHLNSSCQQFDGGSPATELMVPRPFAGAPITLRRNSLQSVPSPKICSRDTATPPSSPPAAAPRGFPLPAAASTTRRSPAVVSSTLHMNSTSMSADSSSKALKVNTLQQEAHPQFAKVRLPETAKPGDVVYAHAFGRQVRLEVPVEVNAEKMLQLQLLNGAITYAVAATMTAAATGTITAAAATTAFAGVCDRTSNKTSGHRSLSLSRRSSA